MTKTPNAYALAGVDVDVEAEASRIMYEATKATWQNRKGRIGEIIVPFDDFSGIKLIDIGGLPPGSSCNIGGDGTGTKPGAAELEDDQETLGFDLIAMIADDAVQKGCEPVVVFNQIDMKTLGTDARHLPRMQRIANGMVGGSRAANVAIMNGELAQLGARVGGYGDFPFNWVGACLWFFKRDKILTGAKICVGDVVILFREKGFRCNGYSLVFKVFRAKYGEDWYKVPYAGSTLGKLVLAPSTIYTRAIVAAHGGFDTDGECEVHGVAHITGGGMPEKLGRLLRPTGYGAYLTDLFDLPAGMRHCQEVGNVSDFDMYRAWNGGQGMGVIAPMPQAVGIMACATRFGIEAKIAGEIVATPGIRLKSRGVEAFGQELLF